MVGEIRIVYDHFPRISREAAQKAQNVVDKTAFDIQATSQQNIQTMDAIDTGAMVNSAYTVTSKGSAYSEAVSAALELNPDAGIVSEVSDLKKLQAAVAYAVLYAIYVHWGARGLAGRPFLLQAVEAHRQRFKEAMKKVVGR